MSLRNENIINALLRCSILTKTHSKSQSCKLQKFLSLCSLALSGNLNDAGSDIALLIELSLYGSGHHQYHRIIVTKTQLAPPLPTEHSPSYRQDHRLSISCKDSSGSLWHRRHSTSAILLCRMKGSSNFESLSHYLAQTQEINFCRKNTKFHYK